VALLAALDYRQRTGRGQYIDVSNLEVGVNCLETAILDYTVNGRIQTRAGNECMVGDLPGAAPHGVYRCQGVNRWCAITVGNDQEWQRFCGILGHPRWTRDGRFTTALRRVQHRDVLNTLVETWTSQLAAEDIMARLQEVGIAAGVVQNAADLACDPQLLHRGQSVRLDHPEVGVQRYDAPAFQLSASAAQLRPVPTLGQHNTRVFKGLLGLSDAEYEAFERDGVFE
jgi:benzylsuccinate CoA-transferase BbsF subunit